VLSFRSIRCIAGLLLSLVLVAVARASVDVESLASAVFALRTTALRRPAGDSRLDVLAGEFLELAWRGLPASRRDPVPLGNVVLIDGRGYGLALTQSVARAADPQAVGPAGEPLGLEVKTADSRAAATLVRLVDGSGVLPLAMVPGLVRPKVGDLVLVVGRAPRGETRVLVRHLSSANGHYYLRNSVFIRGLLVLDGPVPPGWDGAAALDKDGRLVGLTLGWSRPGDALGYVVAMDTLERGVARTLVRRREGAWLGVETKAAVVDGDAGVTVTRVEPGSPAEAAGLLEGDHIVKWQDRPVASRFVLGIETLEARPGQTAHLEVLRDGQRRTVVAALADYPAPDALQLAQELLGATVQELDRDLALGLGVAGVRGIAIVEVERGGPADRIGLRSGDVIVRLGEIQTSTLERFAGVLAVLPPGAVVPMTVRRGGAQVSLELRLRQ